MLTFPQFAALCWCLPILVGAEADFPSALKTGEAAEETPEGAETSSRQTRQSAAPESYSFQVRPISVTSSYLSPLPEHQNRSRRSRRAPIGCTTSDRVSAAIQSSTTVLIERPVPKWLQLKHKPLPICTAEPLPICTAKPVPIWPAKPTSIWPTGSFPKLPILCPANSVYSPAKVRKFIHSASWMGIRSVINRYSNWKSLFFAL